MCRRFKSGSALTAEGALRILSDPDRPGDGSCSDQPKNLPWLGDAFESALAKVFDPDQSLGWIVKINPGSANPVGFQKLRDFDVVTILFPVEIVFDQNECLVRRAMNPVKAAIGSALFDRRDFDFIDIEARKVHPRLANKEIGPHN